MKPSHAFLLWWKSINVRSGLSTDVGSALLEVEIALIELPVFNLTSERLYPTKIGFPLSDAKHLWLSLLFTDEAGEAR